MVYLRYFWQGNHQIYGHIRCIYTVLANPTHADLINVFEVFLPQLLLYPNPADPLNGEAAALLMREPKLYDQKVKGRFRSLA